jgi:hypothetical protein
MVKTIVGSFDDYSAAQRVVRDLVADGFMSGDIGILASNLSGDYRAEGEAEANSKPANSAVGALTGGMVGGAAGAAASLMGLAIPGVGPIVAAGLLVATLSGVAAGAMAGGLIGALTEVGVPEEQANFYAEAVRRGGAVVTVKADESRAHRVEEIMRADGAIDLNERVLRWREGGWEGWNPSAAPYTLAEAERERQLYGTHADALSGLPTTSDPERDNRDDSTIRH